MSNTNVSIKFVITNQKFQANESGSITRYKVDSISPPSNSVFKGIPSFGITKWINPFPDIAFEKIMLPQWGDKNQNNAYTRATIISNQPDYIKDYYFISLMRCSDFYNDDMFQAVINCSVDGVIPAS